MCVRVADPTERPLVDLADSSMSGTDADLTTPCAVCLLNVAFEEVRPEDGGEVPRISFLRGKAPQNH